MEASAPIRIDVPETVIDSWQEIVDILSTMLGVPAALIMRYDDPSIEVLVSSKTDGNPYQPGVKEKLFGSGLYCERVIRTKQKLLVSDALADADWKDNPDVKLNMISYLGFPILLPDHSPFGTLCVLDKKPNGYSGIAEKLMIKLRGLIETHLEILCMNQVLGDKNRQLMDYANEIQALRGLVPICANCKNIRDEQGVWRPVEHYLTHHLKTDFTHGVCPSCMKKYYPEYIGKPEKTGKTSRKKE